MNRSITLLVTAFLAALVITNAAYADSLSSPDTAAYISPLSQRISANSAQWYKFDYAGDKSLVTILIPNGTGSLVEFNVFTPEQALSWWDRDTKPIGRGTAYSTDCYTGEEVYYGECKSNDLKWKGQFNFPGTFFVQVVNYNTCTANFTLDITGTGVHVAPPPFPAAASAVVAPPQTPPLLPMTGGVWLDLLNRKPATAKTERE